MNPEDAPDVLPTVKGMGSPQVPNEIKEADQIEYVDVTVVVGSRGDVLRYLPIGSNTWLTEQASIIEEIRPRWKPGTRHGDAVNSEVRFSLIFNPASARLKSPDATPRLLGVAPVAVPAGRAPRGFKGKLFVDAELDANGAVVEAVLSGEALSGGGSSSYADAAVDSVRHWRFAPARKGGTSVPSHVVVPVLFVRPSADDLASVDLPPKVVRQEPPVYPLEMRRARLLGRVILGFIVDVEGRVREAHVVESNNPYFDDPALDAVLKWTFTPAIKDGRPVNCTMKVPINFTLNQGPASELFTVSGKAPREGLPPDFQYDYPPKPITTSFGAYPIEELQKGKSGKATVSMIVAPSGAVILTKVQRADSPAFGKAAQAMVETYQFMPATKGGKPCSALLGTSVEFEPGGTVDVPVNSRARDLIRALQSDRSQFVALKDLDYKPRPLSRRPAVFPKGLLADVAAGNVTVEFIIDRTGHAQVPRVTAATREEFGYAAVQAITTWRFTPPLKGGKPVDAIVTQPMEFKSNPNPAAR